MSKQQWYRYGFSGYGSVGGGTALIVQDEGVVVDSNVSTLNFIGADISALTGGAGIVNIYVPAVSYASHFNTTDGTTTGTVSENISRSTAMIGEPTSEGNPFSVNGTGGTNQPATLSSTVTFTTGGDVTGFGRDATMTVTVFDADGLQGYDIRARVGKAMTQDTAEQRDSCLIVDVWV